MYANNFRHGFAVYHTRQMKTRIASFGLVLVLAACGGGQTRDDKPSAPPTPEQVVSAAKTVLEQYEQGYEVLSVAALQPLYLEDLDLVVVVQGQPYKAWTSVEGYLTGFFSRFDAVRLDLADISVVALGDDAAQVTATVTRELRGGSTSVKEIGILSLTLSRVGERWLIRTEHFSYGLR